MRTDYEMKRKEEMQDIIDRFLRLYHFIVSREEDCTSFRQWKTAADVAYRNNNLENLREIYREFHRRYPDGGN